MSRSGQKNEFDPSDMVPKVCHGFGLTSTIKLDAFNRIVLPRNLRQAAGIFSRIPHYITMLAVEKNPVAIRLRVKGFGAKHHTTPILRATTAVIKGDEHRKQPRRDKPKRRQ